MAHIFVPLLCGALILTVSSSLAATTANAPPSLSPTPAPAPSPQFVNLTDLLTVAGPFHTFLNYLVQTKVIDTFQNQANNTEQGITIFVPTDAAFASLKKPSLSNLTQDQLKSLILFHALPNYYSLAEFKNLSHHNPVSTFAGSQYTLNFSDASGSIHADSSWSNPKISSSVIATRPVAVYEIEQVLLPIAIFGEAPPPAPAPAPAPETLKPLNSTPPVQGRTAGPPELEKPANSATFSNGFDLMLVIFCGTMMLLL